MFSQWCSSGNRMTSFHMATMILLSLLLILKHTECQFPPVFMYPNEDDQVLQVGATLNLTCSINIPAVPNDPYARDHLNITWTLPVQLTASSIVRNISLHSNNFEELNFFSWQRIISFLHGFYYQGDRIRYYFNANETHIWSTMTLSNTTTTDIGYYGCERTAFLNISISFVKRSMRTKYVYVFSL